MGNNREKGKLGEEIAVAYLIENGYSILCTNFSSRGKEIDIIAKKSSALIFVEVKLRKSLKFGYPREAVTFAKQNNIKQAANYYIYKNGIVDCDFQFDIIEILDTKTERKLEHIKDAFY